MPQIQNPNCDGAHCRSETCEVRIFPLGSGGNLHLCAACFAHENRYRQMRAVETKNPQAFPPVDWNSAEKKEH